jgi:hypothetical protein
MPKVCSCCQLSFSWTRPGKGIVLTILPRIHGLETIEKTAVLPIDGGSHQQNRHQGIELSQAGVSPPDDVWDFELIDRVRRKGCNWYRTKFTLFWGTRRGVMRGVYLLHDGKMVIEDWKESKLQLARREAQSTGICNETRKSDGAVDDRQSSSFPWPSKKTSTLSQRQQVSCDALALQ